MMFDRSVFVRPVAHRGLHGHASDAIENTAVAFAAGLDRGYGIECDLQPASDDTPMVFHDDTLDRLMEATGRIDALTPRQLEALNYRGRSDRILTFADLLELAAGRGPLLVEIKSDWRPPREAFLKKIAALCTRYKGPLALMSFDPVVMAAVATLVPRIPRGIVSGVYVGAEWEVDKLGLERAARLTDLLESRAAAPSFYAYDVKRLPTPVTRYIREVQGLPLFTWTVRTAADRATAAAWADASIFESSAEDG